MTATTFFPHLADALPASPAARDGTPPALPAPRATQRRRRLRVARTLAVVSVRKALLPRGATRARQRLRVCSAADILTALDVRVAVIGSAVPWPRLGRVVVSDHTGWLGDLSLSTAAPGTPVLSGDSTRTLPVGSVACPVVLRYRTAAGYLAPSEVPRTLAETAAARDLVVEVHRLPALSTAPGPASASLSSGSADPARRRISRIPVDAAILPSTTRPTEEDPWQRRAGCPTRSACTSCATGPARPGASTSPTRA